MIYFNVRYNYRCVETQFRDNVKTSNSYNFVVSEPIWTIPGALETGEKRATFYRNNLKVKDVKLERKEKLVSHVAPTNIFMGGLLTPTLSRQYLENGSRYGQSYY